MNAFEDGERVRYVGIAGLHSKWNGREGVVLDTFKDYDGTRVMVQFDGEDRGVSFDEDDFEAVKSTYTIEDSAEDAVSVTLELTDAEAALITRVAHELKAARNQARLTYAPRFSITKETK